MLEYEYEVFSNRIVTNANDRSEAIFHAGVSFSSDTAVESRLCFTERGTDSFGGSRRGIVGEWQAYEGSWI